MVLSRKSSFSSFTDRFGERRVFRQRLPVRFLAISFFDWERSFATSPEDFLFFLRLLAPV